MGGGGVLVCQEVGTMKSLHWRCEMWFDCVERKRRAKLPASATAPRAFAGSRRACVRSYVHLYVCVYICVCVYVCMCADMYICIYMHVCMYMYIYVFIHVYVYVYAYLCIGCGS